MNQRGVPRFEFWLCPHLLATDRIPHLRETTDPMHDVAALLREYDRARAYTDELWKDLSPDEVIWRPSENSSAIGWHLGHQAHVAHFMIRNLIAAEPSPAPELDALMDSARDGRSSAAHCRPSNGSPSFATPSPSACTPESTTSPPDTSEPRRAHRRRHPPPGRPDQPRIPARPVDRRSSR